MHKLWIHILDFLSHPLATFFMLVVQFFSFKLSSRRFDWQIVDLNYAHLLLQFSQVQVIETLACDYIESTKHKYDAARRLKFCKYL